MQKYVCIFSKYIQSPWYHGARVSDKVSCSHLRDRVNILNWRITRVQFFYAIYDVTTRALYLVGNYRRCELSQKKRLERRLRRKRLSPYAMTLAQFDIRNTSRPALVICAHLVCKRQIARAPLRNAIDEYRNSLSLIPLDRRAKRNRESMLSAIQLWHQLQTAVRQFFFSDGRKLENLLRKRKRGRTLSSVLFRVLFVRCIPCLCANFVFPREGVTLPN